MNVRQINLDDDERPKSIVVEMSADEALFLAVVTGKQNYTTGEAIMTGGSDLSGEIYSAMSGGVFNRFYEGGVDDALCQRGSTNTATSENKGE